MARPSISELLGDAIASPVVGKPPVESGAQPSAPGTAGGTPVAIVGGAYEGAERFSREMHTWRPSMNSADGDLLPVKELADARSRDTLRNDAYVQGASALHKDNIVGDHYRLNAKPAFNVLGLDEAWATAFQQEVEEKFTLWAESPENWVDAQRTKTFTDMIRLAVGMMLSSGEVLAVAEYIRGGNRPFRTAIQMIDPDRLSNPHNVSTSPLLRAGIKHDRLGAPEVYYIRESHPADYLQRGNLDWRAVPARKPWGRQQVIHIFEQLRPAQSRGVSDLVAALKELRTTKRFREVVLQNAVLNATFAASIESALPTEDAFAAIGVRNRPETSNPYADHAENFFGAVEQFHGSGSGLTLNGVRIPHLFPGTKLNLTPVGDGGPLGNEFEQSLLRYIASSLGVSYEQLSRDYTQTNYSSARAAMNETWKFMQSRKRIVADRFASAIYALWLEEAISSGSIEAMAGREDLFYAPLGKEALCKSEWIGASRGQIDELKETQAAALRLKYNLTTQEREAARLGLDWRDVNAQRERETKDLIERGLVVDPADQALNAASGSPQEREPDEEPEDGSEDNTDV